MNITLFTTIVSAVHYIRYYLHQVRVTRRHWDYYNQMLITN